LQDLHTAYEFHSVSKNAAVSGATAPKPPTNLCALIATNTNAARGEAESDESMNPLIPYEFKL